MGRLDFVDPKDMTVDELLEASDVEEAERLAKVNRGNYRVQDGCHNCAFYFGYCDERANIPVDGAGVCDLFRKREDDGQEEG